MKNGSLTYQITQRVDSLCAFGISRHSLKSQVRAQGKGPWNPSTGLIHSYKTRRTYLDQALRFARWAKSTHSVRSLAELDDRRRELATAYLLDRQAARHSPWSIQTYRAALRLVFRDRELGADVLIDRRRRESITRSRRPVPNDREFAPARHDDLIRFIRATGLRRHEAKALRVGQVHTRADGTVELRDIKGKGGKVRSFAVVPGNEADVLNLVRGRDDKDRVFASIPQHYDEHADRRAFAQALYRAISGREPPSPHGRLRPGSYDRKAVLIVSSALGHSRADVVLRHYLR